MPTGQTDELRRQLERGLLATRVGLHACRETDKAIGAALDDVDPKYGAEAERLQQKLLADGPDASDADYDGYLACLRSRYHLRRARGRLRTGAAAEPERKSESARAVSDLRIRDRPGRPAEGDYRASGTRGRVRRAGQCPGTLPRMPPHGGRAGPTGAAPPTIRQSQARLRPRMPPVGEAPPQPARRCAQQPPS